MTGLDYFAKYIKEHNCDAIQLSELKDNFSNLIGEKAIIILDNSVLVCDITNENIEYLVSQNALLLCNYGQ